MKKALFYIALIFMLAGCATNTENVASSPDEVSYKDMTCDQLSQEQHRLLATLAAARDAQRSHSDFGFGGNFNGIPVTGLSEGKGTEVDRLKDQLQAVQKAAFEKNCTIPPLPANP